MIDAVDQAAAALRIAAMRVDAASHNVANAATPGFQRVFASASRTAGSATAPAQLEARLTLDARPGPVTLTGDAHDVAVNGDGFFVVDTPRGPRLHRSLHLTLNPDGAITNPAGRNVQGSGGPLNAPGTGPLTVDRAGNVSRGGRTVGQLSVVTVPNAALLIPDADGLSAPQGVPLTPLEQPQVEAGAVVGSNVDVPVEAVSLVSASRHFEAVQRALRVVDRLLGRTLADQ